MREQPDERLVGVGGLPGRADRGGLDAGDEPGGRGRQNAARHRDQGRGERDRHVGSAGDPQVLLDLRNVAVGAADRVGLGGPERLGREQVRLERLACAGVPVGEHCDQVGGLDHAGRDPGRQPERDGGDVAAGHGDALGAHQCAALGRRRGLPGVQQLRKAVGPAPGVGAAVELPPGRGVGQPVVGAQVEHDRVRVELGRELARRAVRQAEHDHVVTRERLGRGLTQHPVGDLAQMRMVLAERRAGTRVRRERPDPGLGVPEQQPQRFTAGVPAGTGHRH